MTARKPVSNARAPKLLLEEGIVSGVFQYRRGCTVYSQGDTADGAYYVAGGRLMLSLVSREGKEAVIEIVSAGEFLGEDCLPEQAVRTCTAITLENATLMRIERSDLRHLIRRSPEFTDAFVRHLLRRNGRIRESLADLFFSSSEQRLVRALLSLTEDTPDQHEAALPRVSQSTLAAMVGTTRSRVSFFLGRLRKMGMIDGGRGIRINRPRLLSLAREEPLPMADTPRALL